MTATTVTPESSVLPTTDVAMEISRAVGYSVSALLSSNASSATLETALGTATVFDLSRAGGERASFSAAGGSKVSLSAAVLASLPPGAILAVLSVAGESDSKASEDPLASLGPLASQVMDLSVYGADGQPVRVDLPEPILFKLPGSDGGCAGRCSCVFLETNTSVPAFWSRRGVRRASTEEVLQARESPAGIWCLTEHLSIFTSIAEAFQGCTNLELLSQKALDGISEHPGWYNAESAIIVFIVWGLLVLVYILGLVRERWAYRLGATHHAANKSVNICRNFMTWGPQLLKHKYAAFVVFAKDILHCVTAQKNKLRLATLTAAVQRFLAVRSGISVQCVRAHCWDGGAWIESKASLPYTVICWKLNFHAGLADKVIMEDMSPGGWAMLRRSFMTLLAVHPMLDAMRVGAGSMTVGKRTALQIAGICGVITTNALIFSFSGEFRSWEAEASCPISPTSQLFIIVASFVSVSVNALPNAFLVDLAKQVHGRPLWNVVFWFCTLAYLSLTVLFILAALANLNSTDQDKWYKSLEWGMSIKILGMPFAQCLRHSIMLETFLRLDQQSEPSTCFRVTMGLSHAREVKLAEDERHSAESLARHAISAEEILNFTARLGDVLMPEFSATQSTSEDVLRGAIEPLCVKPPALENFAVAFQVSEADGLQLEAGRRLTCTVVHLGKAVGNERFSISEHCSDSAAVALLGSTKCCRWAFQADVAGLDAEHAVAFLLREEGGRSVALGWLEMEEVLQGGSSTLPLHPVDFDGTGAFTRPAAAAFVPAHDVTGSRGLALHDTRAQSYLSVRVSLPEGYRDVLGLHAFKRLKSKYLPHQSEVPDGGLEAQLASAEEPMQWAQVYSMGAFCEARSFKEERLPPEAMVVHSREATYLHLVAAVLSDAFGDGATIQEVHAKLLAGEYHVLGDLLQERRRGGRRYWIDIFALKGSIYQSNDWQHDLMASWPSRLRAMRRFSCDKLESDIMAGKCIDSQGPLRQLVLLDTRFVLMHDWGCLAELMLAKSMHLRQRLVLLPEHLVGPGLGEELHLVAKELASPCKDDAPAHATPYLENRHAVWDTLRDLAVQGVKEQKEDNEATWQELSMTNVFASLGALSESGSVINFGPRQSEARNGGDVQLDDIGGVDVDA